MIALGFTNRASKTMLFSKRKFSKKAGTVVRNNQRPYFNNSSISYGCICVPDPVGRAFLPFQFDERQRAETILSARAQDINP